MLSKQEFEDRYIGKIHCADCLTLMKDWPDNCVDLIFTSPPYEDARTYGIDFNLKGQEWVDWALVRFKECVRVCKGLVCWVVKGKTKKFRWTATPALLMADLHRAGVHLRKPPAFHRVGIPGSGGPDWLRNDYEFIICATKGKLPWSDNTAMGHKPAYDSGGGGTYRNQDGTRNQCPHYANPKIANPGNVIHCKVGGGHIGNKLAHESEAPFPERLAEFFIKSFCAPERIVLDPFIGSGTTAAVAERFGRRWIGIDIRESQVELSQKRIEEEKSKLALFK